MPSGAKKRKAAKRKKEKQEKGKEKEEERGSIPLPSPPPQPQPQGSGLVDWMPHDDGRRSESGEFETPSGTPFATPLSQANHPLAEEAGEETPGSQRVAVHSSVESSGNGNGEADELPYRPDELANDDATELEVETVAPAEDEVAAAPPYDVSVEIVRRSEKGEPREAESAEGTEMEKPAEESVIAVEQSVLTREEAEQEKEALAEILKEAPVAISLQCELKAAPLPAKDEIKEQLSSYEREVKVVPLPSEDEVKEEASYEREVKVVPLPDEDDQKNRPSYECEVKIVPQPDENEVKEQPSHEHDADANVGPLPDKDEVKERKVAALPDEHKVKEQPSHEREVKVVPLLDEDVTGTQFCVSGEASQGSRRAETVPSAEVAPHAPTVMHRARWWNCCGLLDVLVGSER
ncbi:uncharacterized protein PF11_0207 [Phoenix dactylifera]|uniref:Uncharacterized protein PF11_0207 n=1 Tax=Phoenix dactylifera TaxID=42345 RepID=A0A8B8IZC9_PHODC|nr:uncharacterized protein PF11_0207 [Phoenix dactylifera]XP_026656461.2 uncharacterized protein PF11_0207 [Phoenix dactylifera]XP_026656462.2 uncharacterized protein PF11_0207 [Phoenix dactylifera]XP_038981755.1 uncharacterized protein PF11_0207 [Phoenix dactylifera]